MERFGDHHRLERNAIPYEEPVWYIIGKSSAYTILPRLHPVIRTQELYPFYHCRSAGVETPFWIGFPYSHPNWQANTPAWNSCSRQKRRMEGWWRSVGSREEWRWGEGLCAQVIGSALLNTFALQCWPRGVKNNRFLSLSTTKTFILQTPFHGANFKAINKPSYCVRLATLLFRSVSLIQLLVDPSFAFQSSIPPLTPFRHLSSFLPPTSFSRTIDLIGRNSPQFWRCTL